MFQAKWGSFTIVNIVCLVFIFSSYFYFSFFSDQFFLTFSQRCLFVYPESFLIYKGNECDLYLIWIAMETWTLVMCYQITNFSGNKGYYCECRYVCYNKKLFNIWTPSLKSERIKHLASEDTCTSWWETLTYTLRKNFKMHCSGPKLYIFLKICCCWFFFFFASLLVY